MPNNVPQRDQPDEGQPKGHLLRRNVSNEGETPRQKWMREKAAEIDRALGINSGDFAPTDDGGFVQEGEGYIIMGMGGPETAPRAMPPEAELRKAAEAPHRFPDLAQAPLREQFPDDASFERAVVKWLVNVTPVVVRRNKRLIRCNSHR